MRASRRKKDSSVSRAVDLVKNGQAEAVVGDALERLFPRQDQRLDAGLIVLVLLHDALGLLSQVSRMPRVVTSLGGELARLSNVVTIALDFLLRLGSPGPPRASVRAVQCQLAAFPGIGPDQGKVGGWNEDGIIRRESQSDHLPG